MHKHLSCCVALAQHATHQFRHAAVVYKGKRVFGLGWNNNKPTSVIDAKFPYPTRHAEIAAMINATNQDISGCDVLVIRVGRHNNNLLNSRPCEMCQDTMRKYGIRRCYYSISPNEIGCLHIQKSGG